MLFVSHFNKNRFIAGAQEDDFKLSVLKKLRGESISGIFPMRRADIQWSIIMSDSLPERPLSDWGFFQRVSLLKWQRQEVDIEWYGLESP